MAKKEHTSWIVEIIELIDKYGIFKVLGSVIVMLFISYATFLSLHPNVIFERYSEYEEAKHSESFRYRMETSPMVTTELEALVSETDALRGFVVEMHNGKYNSAGLSFNYGSLTYEALRDSTESIREDYSDFSLDRFPIILKVYKDGYWSGSLEELRKIDKKMALRLESNNANYLAITTIYGKKESIGFIGVTYSKDDSIHPSLIEKELRKYASKVSPLLDGSEAKD